MFTDGPEHVLQEQKEQVICENINDCDSAQAEVHFYLSFIIWMSVVLVHGDIPCSNFDYVLIVHQPPGLTEVNPPLPEDPPAIPGLSLDPMQGMSTVSNPDPSFSQVSF